MVGWVNDRWRRVIEPDNSRKRGGGDGRVEVGKIYGGDFRYAMEGNFRLGRVAQQGKMDVARNRFPD